MSTILDQHRRHIVVFDPTNKEHVEVISRVLKGESIADAPVRFAFSPPFTSGVTQAIHTMAQAWVEHALNPEPVVVKFRGVRGA